MNTSILRGLVAMAVAVLLVAIFTEPSLALAAEQTVGRDVTTYTFHNSKGVAFLFWFLAAATIGGAIFVITRRNMVTAVMGMVGTFFAIAGLFLMLYASFLAVIQVLVYAGAIMVLFVFVIMILNRPESEPWAIHGLLGKGLAAIGLLYLFKRLASLLWQVKDTHALVLAKDQLGVEVILNHADPELMSRFGGNIRNLDVGSIKEICESGLAICRDYDFGSVQGVGYTLFSDYLLPFEAVSIVLLVAVVGAIAIARPAPEAVAEVSDETPTPEPS